MESNTFLEVKDLKTHFRVGKSVVKAVDGVSFKLNAGEITAIVGESGSGKSITSLSIMKLLPTNVIDSNQGLINFKGKNLLNFTEKEMRKIRGNKISMIFQEPMTSLNPVYNLSYQISEAIILHQKRNKTQARKIAVEMLDLVGIPEPNKRIDSFPHELSGGMRQRAMIAMALCCKPEILIADEPTTALDVTIQAQILELMQSLQKKLGMSILFITHDLGVVSEIADKIIVMYAGQVVESGNTDDIFKNSKMPYTLGLMNSIPKIIKRKADKKRLKVIPGNVPNHLYLPSGCRFHPRCEYSDNNCKNNLPSLEEITTGHSVRCVLWKNINP
jgi:oligopeptide/dipeptide ABC transporter ATP-binding protein|tara:strand:+ start:3005 stop:3997 length:993 start_codon:yes stop_codon:yes gene_type:complete